MIDTLLRPRAGTLLLGAALCALGLALLVGPGPGAAVASGGVSASGTTTSTSDGETRAERLKRKYRRLWRKVPKRQKRWASRTAQCESGRDPKAIGGGGRYRGAFQFMRATWRSSPKTPGGDPIRFNYKTQAVVAVALKRRDGAGHWPTCG